jgi:DNA-3-methyladenine glycosylase
MAILPRSFYTRPDVVLIARELLGKQLFTRIDGVTTSGTICETEAYAGITDKASHAYGGRRTCRTEVMYRAGGTAYIYLCYGIHSLFNVVTNVRNVPHAVLIRGIIPAEGIEEMFIRTGRSGLDKNSGTGPGKVSKLLGIHYSHTGLDLVKTTVNMKEPAIWIEDTGIQLTSGMITTGPRIGVDYAAEDALLPYRFIMHAL